MPTSHLTYLLQKIAFVYLGKIKNKRTYSKIDLNIVKALILYDI